MNNIKDGASALCVLTPPYNCKGNKYDDNYVSKIVNISDYNSLFTVNREIYLTNIFSLIVKKNPKYKSIEKNIALIVDLCKLNKKDRLILKTKM